MNCPMDSPEDAGLLLDYCAHRLPPKMAGALERHMEGCAVCARFRREQRALWTALDDWDVPPVSQDFDVRLCRRLETERARRGVAASIGGLLTRPALSFACAAASLVLVAVLLNAPPANAPRPADTQWMEADQVERALDDMEMLYALKPAVGAGSDHTPQM